MNDQKNILNQNKCKQKNTVIMESSSVRKIFFTFLALLILLLISIALYSYYKVPLYYSENGSACPPGEITNSDCFKPKVDLSDVPPFEK